MYHHALVGESIARPGRRCWVQQRALCSLLTVGAECAAAHMRHFWRPRDSVRPARSGRLFSCGRSYGGSFGCWWLRRHNGRRRRRSRLQGLRGSERIRRRGRCAARTALLSKRVRAPDALSAYFAMCILEHMRLFFSRDVAAFWPAGTRAARCASGDSLTIPPTCRKIYSPPVLRHSCRNWLLPPPPPELWTVHISLSFCSSTCTCLRLMPTLFILWVSSLTSLLF